MTNFSIIFANPWLLLLLIPAVGLTLLSYFKLNKRYRRTRNHITSIVLHLIVMVLSIAVLAGIAFGYNIPNNDNEIILLVDASYSTSDSQDDVDDFIKEVIDNSDSMFDLGIVTFGYNQVYASELTNNTSNTFSDYIKAELPDTSATDIASALTYASSLFTKPESAKIVLISDAIETDGNVAGVIKAISAQGIMVDTVCFTGKEAESEVQIVSLAPITDKVIVGQKFSFTVSIQSSYEGIATITPYDNSIEGEAVTIDLKPGIQEVNIPYMFTLPGMHEMSFEIQSADDQLTQNNSLISYVYLEVYDKILVIESIDNESAGLCSMLGAELNVKVVNVEDTDAMPKTLKDLREFDEVILCNIANDDMPEGFIDILYSYVHDIGGGLFTICGNEFDSNPNDDDWTANAYTREDMYGTLYQQMLPVEAIKYTPPVGVMIIIDTSGSMLTMDGGSGQGSKLYAAKQGAEACLDALTERDYVGIMTLSDAFTEEIQLTPRTQREKILASIDKIDSDGGGTIFSASLERAGKALSALSQVDKRHIIVVTDGEPSGGDEEAYQYWMQENAKNGITMSIVGIQCTASAQSLMESILVEYAGVEKSNFHNVDEISAVPQAMREDLEVSEIKEVNYETFVPKINGFSPIVNGLKQADIPTLDGFYGLKLKSEASAILMGEFTPIYSQWQFGKGRVGTFACDLNGVWSNEFIHSDMGSRIVKNIVTALFPSESVRFTDIDAEISGDNYSNQLSIFTDLNENDFIEVTITSPSTEAAPELVQKFTANAQEGFSRLNFSVTTPGIHKIEIQKKDVAGRLLTSYTTYKILSYSKEYNVFNDPDVAKGLAENIAASTGGELIDEPVAVFEDATKYLYREIDPTVPFIIIVIVLFLLDIAVRKFKWKWPHEIIRDRKARKARSSK